MSLNDGSANRQAHPGALGFRRKERMEDAVGSVLRGEEYPVRIFIVFPQRG
jgi:hypothetical protein